LWWQRKCSAPFVSALANFVTNVDDEIKSGSHYILLASMILNNIESILKENKALLKWVALAARDVARSVSSSLFANSGCTIYFFKNWGVFFLYKALNKFLISCQRKGLALLFLEQKILTSSFYSKK
jgi:hypothetical protein